jgi:class 3 adenylate cyclase
MGDTVNLASRLEAANKVYGSHCVISEATVAAAGGALIYLNVFAMGVPGAPPWLSFRGARFLGSRVADRADDDLSAC